MLLATTSVPKTKVQNCHEYARCTSWKYQYQIITDNKKKQLCIGTMAIIAMAAMRSNIGQH